MSLTVIAFVIFAVGAIATAILMITRSNAIPAALCLIAHFFCLSGLYLTLQAAFLATLQILVYAGAIMVLVVFVIMLLNLHSEAPSTQYPRFRMLAGILITGILALELTGLAIHHGTGLNELPAVASIVGSAHELGRVLYTDYLFPFEAVSLLLLAAIVGAVVLAKRTLED
ncbi:MAG: NADH-quinone oxidoreductase subunit J [Bacteroidota bacterium]|nr:NADH-quinone oxidoreductase subunit J [Candidatus Kapabacteria bacterium]MDW8219451.1 NADH-quinone oxidoreductase subunit J [Bacteroidota bacterium]